MTHICISLLDSKLRMLGKSQRHCMMQTWPARAAHLARAFRRDAGTIEAPQLAAVSYARAAAPSPALGVISAPAVQLAQACDGQGVAPCCHTCDVALPHNQVL